MIDLSALSPSPSHGPSGPASSARGDRALGLVLLALLASGCTHGASSEPPGPAAASSAANPDPLMQPQSALIAGRSLAVAYSGFRHGQHPDRGSGAVEPTPEQILEDLQILTKHDRFGLIRLYDAKRNSRLVLELIREHRVPIKVMLGAWLEGELSNHEGCAWVTEPVPEAELKANAANNRAEVAAVIELANAYPEVVVAVNVGNEALVSWNDHLVELDSMLGYLRQVKAAIAQPVSTADNYVVWIDKGAALAEVVDFAMIHTYPVWENKTIDQGLAFTVENLAAVRAALPELPMVIGEAGWPTVASEFSDRVGTAEQARYFRELTGWAEAHNVTLFFFEAFDEDWKGNPADPDGAEKHWGLFDIDRRPKPVVQAWFPELTPSDER